MTILLSPRALIFVCFVYQLICIEITSKIIADKIPINLECANQTRENIRITKSSLLNLITNLPSGQMHKGSCYLLEFRIHLSASIHMTMSQIIDILTQMPKQKDIIFTYFSCNFNIGTIDRSQNQSAIKREFHITRSRSFCSSG